MRVKLAAVVVIALTLLAACESKKPEGASVQGTVAQKSTCDRACLEKFVDRYMDAMLEHAVRPELFAKDCKFTENGVRLPLGDEGLWASMVGKGTYKFYVPDVETQQIGFIGTAREEPMKPDKDKPASVAIALRLRIVNNLITEAEQLVIRPETDLFKPNPNPPPSAADNIEKMGKELGSPHPIFAEIIPEDKRMSREELIETANYYFTGMQKNDGKGYYPFADKCDRYENGGRATNVPLKPGEKRPDPKTSTVYSGAWTAKEQFESGLIFFVSRIRDRRFVAVDRERGVVYSFVFFDHGAGKTRRNTTKDGRKVIEGPSEPWTWQIAELFKVEKNKEGKGEITRIEAVLHRCPYGMNSGWSSFEKGWSDQIQDIK
jgi:hypothetical protein